MANNTCALVLFDCVCDMDHETAAKINNDQGQLHFSLLLRVFLTRTLQKVSIELLTNIFLPQKFNPYG